MNRKRLMIIGIGVIVLMILVNFSGLAQADSVHNNFAEWELTTENDTHNLKETDASVDNNYRNYYQLLDGYEPYIDEIEQDIFTGASTNQATYGFTQTVFDVSGDNESFLSDNGDYEATYTDISDFYSFDISDDGDTDVDYDDYYGRLGVIKIYDNDISEYAMISNELDNNLMNGTFEFWILSTDVSKQFEILLLQGTTLSGYMGIKDNYFSYYNAPSWINLLKIENNFWYHISIDFDCQTDSFDFRINDMEFSSYSFDTESDYIDKFRFNTKSSESAYTIYLDAIGIYNDYQLAQPIPTEYYGNHTFNNSNVNDAEFFANNTFGVNDNYQAFDGWESFENQKINENPTGWTVVSTGGTNKVIQESGNFGKVLEFNDVSASGDVIIHRNDLGNQVSGTIEFYWKVNDTSQYYGLSYNDNVQNAILFYIHDGYFKVYDGASFGIISGAPIPQNNVWYEIQIDFESAGGGYKGLSADTWQVSINETTYGAFDYRVARDYINKAYFCTGVSQTGKMYIDSLDHSWEVDYSENRIQDTKEYNSNFYYTMGSGCLISINGALDGHENILEFDDDSSSNAIYAQTYFENQEYGTYEFYYRTDDATYSNYLNGFSDTSYPLYIVVNNNKFTYRDSVSWKDICACADNIWYHVSIDFECGSSGYEGLSPDTFNIRINGVEYSDLGFYTTVGYVNSLKFYTYTTYTDDFYIDALDYSWSEGYYENRNMDYNNTDWLLYTNGGTVDIISELNGHKNVIELDDTSSVHYITAYNFFETQESGTIEFYFCTDDASITALFDVMSNGNYAIPAGIYNEQFFYYSTGYNYICSANDDTWYHILIDFECGSGSYKGLSPDTFKITINDVEYGAYSFYQSQSSVNKFGFRSENANINTFYADAVDYSWSDGYYENRNMDFYYDVVQESEYQINENRYPDVVGYSGIHLFSVGHSFNDGATPKNMILFRTIINLTDIQVGGLFYEYDSGWVYLSFELWDNISIVGVDTIEIHTHSYYGINEYGFESGNYKIEVFLDGNETSSFEYHHYIITAGDDIELEMYEYQNILYYSLWNSYNKFSSLLSGNRYLYDDTTIYENFVSFPLFRKNIAITPYEPDDTETITGNYWLYSTYTIQFWYNDTIIVGELEVDYNMIQVCPNEAKFYYRLVGDTGLVNWGFIGEWNWLRDALVWIVNILVMIPIQFLMYCLTVAFNFLIMFLIVGSIVVFFWNILLRALIYLGLLIVWGLMFLYNAIIMPFFSWMLEIGIPLIVDILIVVWAIVLASFIWLISLGTADYEVLFETLVDLMEIIADYIVDIITYFITHLPEILLYAGAYIMLVFFIYLKKIYCKAKGYRKRTESLEQSLATYMIPITTVQKAIAKTQETIPVV